jgi:hypothetical protein
VADAEPGTDLGAWVVSQWNRGDMALARERRDYWLNLSFIEGEQWVVWNSVRHDVAEYPRARDDDRVRLTANRMQPNLTNLLAKLTKRNLAFEVPPSAADDSAVGGSRLGEHLLEASRNDCQWEQVRYDALYAAFLGGTAAVVVEWDPNTGGQLAVDPETMQPVNEGNVQLSALAVTEFTLEPGTRTWSDARWFIMAKAMPPEQVRDQFALSETPAADAQMGSGPLQRRLWNDRGYPANVGLTNVFTYYERPTTKKKKGRWAVVVNNRAVVDKGWPFPFDTLNAYPFRQMRIPKRWTGHTLLNDARPLQVAYNHGISMLSEHMKLAGNARLAIPDNSGIEIDDLSDLPGELVFYDGMASSGPHWLEPPNIPRWLIDQVSRIKADLDDVMAVHDISRGVAPGDRNSGLALSVLAEKDETPTGLMAHDQSIGWGYIATLVLKLWEDKVAEYRDTTVQSDVGIPVTRSWTGKMLHDQTRATVPLDNVMPHSRVALQAWITSMIDHFPQLGQAIGQSPAMLARVMDIPGASMFGEVVNADAAQAQRENMLMETGQVPSRGAEPYPSPFDDHATHIAEHNRYRKSQAYQYADQRVRDIVDMHVLAHENMALKEMASQRQANQLVPGAGALPQAHEPPGTAVPPDQAEQQPVPGGPGNPSAGPGAMAGAAMPGVG